MSVCNPCLKTDILPVCTDNIVVGEISSPDTDVFVYVKDITTHRCFRFEETSDNNGIVTITSLNQEPDFMQNHSYELWITLATATGIEDREDILVDNASETTECISLEFKRTGEEYTSVTIKA